jgi:hypothetical protein
MEGDLLQVWCKMACLPAGMEGMVEGCSVGRARRKAKLEAL